MKAKYALLSVAIFFGGIAIGGYAGSHIALNSIDNSIHQSIMIPAKLFMKDGNDLSSGIEAAIDASKDLQKQFSGNVILTLPPGTFYITKPITLSGLSNMGIEGAITDRARAYASFYWSAYNLYFASEGCFRRGMINGSAEIKETIDQYSCPETRTKQFLWSLLSPVHWAIGALLPLTQDNSGQAALYSTVLVRNISDENSPTIMIENAHDASISYLAVLSGG